LANRLEFAFSSVPLGELCYPFITVAAPQRTKSYPPAASFRFDYLTSSLHNKLSGCVTANLPSN